MAPITLPTKAEFAAYEAVRISGVTNMLATSIVSEITGLDEDIIKAVIKNHSELCDRYPEIRR